MSAPQTAKVTEVMRRHPWEKDGEVKKVFYDLRVEGLEKPISIGVDPKKPELEPGSDVTFVLTGKEDRGKLAASEPQQRGGGRGGGRSPEERRSIARQHAQKAAMTYADIKAEKGDLPEKFKVSDLKPIIDWLYQDVLAAEKQQ